jgi:hypothetical protein
MVKSTLLAAHPDGISRYVTNEPLEVGRQIMAGDVAMRAPHANELAGVVRF